MNNKTRDIFYKYNSLKNKFYHLKLEDENFSGYFNNETLEIGFCMSDEIKYYLKEIDSQKLPDEPLSEFFLNTNDEYKILAKMFQAFAHEVFHMVQMLTFQSLNEFVYWYRDTRDSEFFAFIGVCQSQVKWSLEKNSEIFDGIDFIKDEQLKSGLKQKQNKHNYVSSNIFDNWIRDDEEISTWHLIEGNAFSFQWLNTSINPEKIFKINNDNLYKKAYINFLSKIPLDKQECYPPETLNIIFFYITSYSLMFGSNATEINDSSRVINIFNELSRYFNKYIDIANPREETTIPINENLSTKEIAEYLFGNELTKINDISQNYLLKIIKTFHSDGGLSKVITFMNLAKTIINDIESYSKDIDMSFCKYYDRKMEPLYEKYKSTIPLFDHKFFPVFAHLDKSLTQRIFFSLSELDRMQIKSVNGHVISFYNDSKFSAFMNRFEKLLKYGQTTCCRKHGLISDKRTIISCDQKDSLRNQIKMFGEHIELKNLLKRKI